MCLLLLLSVCLSQGAVQTKQTAVFMKQGRATRVFCLVVHFNTHVYICAHAPSQIPFASRPLPALLPFLPAHSCWASLSLPWLAPSQTARNATRCDLSPTTRRGAGLDKGPAAVMCPGPEGKSKAEPRLSGKTHTRLSCSVVYFTHRFSSGRWAVLLPSLSLAAWEIVEHRALVCVWERTSGVQPHTKAVLLVRAGLRGGGKSDWLRLLCLTLPILPVTEDVITASEETPSLKHTEM